MQSSISFTLIAVACQLKKCLLFHLERDWNDEQESESESEKDSKGAFRNDEQELKVKVKGILKVHLGMMSRKVNLLVENLHL